ncbi:hypothetical protein [Streptomyces syringium]|uniref:hypothetical protein n=1 Tax=Streptomyces syringium TaxID=76729 RepID=UPI00345474DA
MGFSANETGSSARATRAERFAADREAVRRVIGFGISDEEFDQAPDVLGDIWGIVTDKARGFPARSASPGS